MLLCLHKRPFAAPLMKVKQELLAVKEEPAAKAQKPAAKAQKTAQAAAAPAEQPPEQAPPPMTETDLDAVIYGPRSNKFQFRTGIYFNSFKNLHRFKTILI